MNETKKKFEMNCKTLHSKLIFFLDGDLPEKEMEQVREHLAECPDCSAFAEELKKTMSVLQIEKSPEVNPFFYTRLKAKLENQAIKNKRSYSLPVWQRILQPAIFTILLIGGIYSGFKIAEPQKVNREAMAYLEQETIPYLNEMQSEPIETFLMEQNHDNEE